MVLSTMKPTLNGPKPLSPAPALMYACKPRNTSDNMKYTTLAEHPGSNLLALQVYGQHELGRLKESGSERCFQVTAYVIVMKIRYLGKGLIASLGLIVGEVYHSHLLLEGVVCLHMVLLPELVAAN